MIRNKCDYLNGAIAVPTDVIDKHLKLAPAASFKVLLFVLRNSDCTTDSSQISAGTGISVEDVEECISYWESYGVLFQDEIIKEELAGKALGNLKSLDAPEKKSEDKSVEKEKQTFRPLPVKKPTQREIALRMSEEPALQIMYREVQNILGTFGYDTQAVLLMIHDYYGMSAEAVITLVQYQKNIKNTATSAIKVRAEDWAKRGITTLESIDDELLALEKIDVCYGNIKEVLGSSADRPTPRIHKYLRDWAVEWNCTEELIKYALEETGRVLADTNKLLKKLARQGVTSPEQIREKTKKSLPKEVNKTYDINKVGKSNVLKWAQKYAEEENQ